MAGGAPRRARGALRRTPHRGDIWSVRLDPAEGGEQRGTRPVLVVSPAAFNRLGLALVCPVSQGAIGARYAGFAVPLMGAGTDTLGVVLCHQARTLDLAARRARFIEAVPEPIIGEVLARLATLIE
ncbi:MAG: type II toxin-antitoxin system PemK/MazF family toxin [Burkholderiales bacterium]|nr:type II toxin-antitoxin system PemK/MazF family toxin [Burkholderiales bacterium]